MHSNAGRWGVELRYSKEFKVKYKIRSSSVIKDSRAKSVHVYADGRRMVNYALLPHDTRGKAVGVSTSDNTVRPFKFADVQTTGVDRPPVSNHSGMLILCLWAVQTKIHSPATSVQSLTR